MVSLKRFERAPKGACVPQEAFRSSARFIPVEGAFQVGPSSLAVSSLDAPSRVLRIRPSSPQRVATRRRLPLLGTTALVAASWLVSASYDPAHAQDYTWGGTGSTTATSNYNAATNWSNPPTGAPPVAAGQAATFNAAGNATVTVTAGPIAPDSWTLSSTAQAYTITGAAVAFGGTGLTNASTVAQSVANNISGTGGLTQSGTGTLTLSGTNTYIGATSITGGTLQGGAVNTFSAVSATNVATGGTLNLGGFAQTINAVTLTGGTLTNGSLTGAVSSAGGTINALAGAATVTTTAGLTQLTGANNYTGLTTITNGTLQGGAANAFSASSGTTVAAAGTLDLGGFSQTINSVGGAGAITNSVAGTTATLTTGSAGSTTFSGVMSDGGATAKLGLTKQGTGTYTLSGANTYSGLTSVTAGTLQAGAANAFSANSAMALSGTAAVALNNFNQTVGSLAGVAGTTVALGTATLTAGGDNTSTTFGGIVSGAGGLTKTGTGNLTLTGANTYSGASVLNTGTVTLSGAGTLGNGSATNLLMVGLPGGATADATLDLGGTTQTTGAVTLKSGSINNGTLISSSFSAQSGSIGAILAGTAGLTKTTTGTLIVSGANTYSNATNVNLGTLVLSGAGTLGDGSATNNLNIGLAGGVASGAVVDLGGLARTTAGALNLTSGTLEHGTFTAAAFNVQSGVISADLLGAGALNKSTIGTALLTNVQDYTGDTNVSGGLLEVSTNGGITQSANLNVASGATFQVDAGQSATFTVSATNSGTINNAGTITDTLTNNAGAVVNNSGTYNADILNSGIVNNSGTINTIAAGFTNNAGGVLTSTNGTLNATAGGFANAGTFNVNGGGQSVVTGNIANAGTINLGATGSYGSNLQVNGNLTGGTVVFNLDLGKTDAGVALVNTIGVTGAANTTGVVNAVIGTTIRQTRIATAVGGNFFGFTNGQSVGTNGLTQDTIRIVGNDIFVVSNVNLVPVVPLASAITSTLGSITASFFQPASAVIVAASGGNPDTWTGGPWIRISGGESNVRSASSDTVLGETLQSRTHVVFSGFQTGVDTGNINIGGSGYNAHVGVTGGQVTANSSETLGAATTVAFSIPFVGVYAAVRHDTFSADITYRRDLPDLTINDPLAVASSSRLHTSGDTVFGNIQYGFNVDQYSIQPSMGLNYSKYTLDRLQALGGGTLTFSPIESVLGRVGVQVGRSFPITDRLVLQPFVTGAAWHEFAGNTTATFGDLINPVIDTATTNRIGTFGQVGLGLVAQILPVGFTGFVRGDVRFGDRIDGVSGTFGARYSF